MVEKLQIENPGNRPMHYGDHVVGVLNPPDRLPKVLVYSYMDGTRQFNSMNHDIYEAQKKAKSYNTHKFPTVLKYVGGVILAATALIFHKDIFKWIKNIFK